MCDNKERHRSGLKKKLLDQFISFTIFSLTIVNPARKVTEIYPFLHLYFQVYLGTPISYHEPNKPNKSTKHTQSRGQELCFKVCRMMHYRQQALQAGSPSSSGRSARYSQLPPGHGSTIRARSRHPQQPLARQSSLRATQKVSHTQFGRPFVPSQDGSYDRPGDPNAYDSDPRQFDGHRPDPNFPFNTDEDPFGPAIMDEQVAGSRSSTVSQALESIRNFNRSMNDHRVSNLGPSTAGSKWTRTIIPNNQLMQDLRGLEGGKNSPSSFN